MNDKVEFNDIINIREKAGKYETVQIVRCKDCTYSVPGQDESRVICAMEQAVRDADFFCADCEAKKTDIPAGEYNELPKDIVCDNKDEKEISGC